MKFTIAAIVSAILCAVVIGDGYLKSRRAKQHAVTVTTSLSTMSIQELSRHSEECDQSQGRGQSTKQDAAYCAEVWREIEARPLEVVEVGRVPASPNEGTK
jgi:hypothetical protein